jgi:archaellum component FlaF (FlaF/FlaG flagellin family)
MSGTGTAAATAIILIGVVIGLILAEPSLEDAMDDLRETRKESSEKSLGLANSRISLISAIFNNTTKVLNTTIENEGSTVLEIRHIDILLNGTWAEADFGGKDFIYPSSRVVATLKNVTDPRSVKVVTRYGVSDQTSGIEIET